jgi:Galactose-3-O-sulfotransferase
MTLSDTLVNGATGSAAPNLLIFFHIPKTGGTTMGHILANCFPGDQHFNCYMGVPTSAMSIDSPAMIAEKYNLLSDEAKRSCRCIIGHVPMGIHTLFDRPAKYFTILRHPVERVVSQFYFSRPKFHLIKDMTLEQYMDSRIGLDPFDHQVRLLSGCEELDGPWGVDGKPVPAAPVEDRHLQIAKRNIEERFIIAAPLEEFSSVVVLLRRLYGWSLRNCLYEVKNVTAHRPQVDELPKSTRKRIEDCNRHDMELYEWAKARFADQLRALDPQISRDRYLFNIVNGSSHRIRRIKARNIWQIFDFRST